VHPALKQLQRHVHGREEQDQEHRGLHDRPGLDRLEPHRDPAGPEQECEVDDHRQREEADEIDAVALDPHPREEGDAGDHRGRDQPAQHGADRIAGDDPAPARGRQQQPPGEAVLEVARDPEAGEDTPERGGLEEHETELEAGVSGGVVEALDVAQPRQPAGERGEVDQREGESGEEQRRVVQHVVDHPPADREGNVAEIADHVRVILVRRASPETRSAAARSATVIAKARPRARPSPS